MGLLVMLLLLLLMMHCLMCCDNLWPLLMVKWLLLRLANDLLTLYDLYKLIVGVHHGGVVVLLNCYGRMRRRRSKHRTIRTRYWTGTGDGTASHR